MVVDASARFETHELPVHAVPTDFFPPDTFGSNEAFVSAWYGKHLEAMHEPSLWAATARGQTVYRFLWLRTFDKPIAVRVSLVGDHAHLVATRLSGAGGYAPGTIETQRERDLPLSDIAKVEAALDAAQFDKLPPRTLGSLDGAQWIIERAKNGTYRIVDHWSPEPDDPFTRACNLFLDLAGRDLVVGQVY